MLSPEDYDELIDSTDSPGIRAEFMRLKVAAQKKAEFLARVGERGRRELATYRWQRDTLLQMHRVFALLFEVTSWERRERKPQLAWEARNDLNRKLRGMRKRFARARREAAEGCAMQTRWLADHYEIVRALEEAANSSTQGAPVGSA